MLIDIKILTLDIHPKIRVPIKQAQTIFLSSSAISIELFPTIINNNKKQNNKLTHDIRSRSIKHGMKMYPLVFLVLLFAQCLFPIEGNVNATVETSVKSVYPNMVMVVP